MIKGYRYAHSEIIISFFLEACGCAKREKADRPFIYPHENPPPPPQDELPKLTPPLGASLEMIFSVFFEPHLAQGMLALVLKKVNTSYLWSHSLHLYS